MLTASGLPQQTLGEVWAIADPDNNGFITKDGWYRAARVIGWLQKGNQTQVDASLVNKAGPYPTFSGYPAPPQQPPLAQTPLSANTTGTGALPPLTAADRTKFTRIFVGCGPSNGLVSGDKARDVFLKSKLNYDKLGLIWYVYLSLCQCLTSTGILRTLSNAALSTSQTLSSACTSSRAPWRIRVLLSP